MALETTTERILRSAQGKTSSEAIDALFNAAKENSLISEHLEQIAGHDYFTTDYSKIIDAMDMAHHFGISDNDVLDVILRPGINPKLMEDAVFSIHEGVSPDDIKFAYDSVNEDIGEGFTKEQSEDNATDIMVCRRNGLGHNVLTNNELRAGYGVYSPEQIHAFARLSDNVSWFAEEKFNENISGSSPFNSPHDAGYLNQRIFDTALLNIGCYDETNTPAQIKAIGQSVINYLEPLRWNGVFSDIIFNDMKTIKEAIVSHNSYSSVYDNIVNNMPYAHDITPKEIWTKAKEATVDQAILYSAEAIDYDDPIAGLKRICEGTGLFQADTDKIIETAESLIHQNVFLKEHDAENVDIRFMADMVIEGVPPKDIPDYINIMGHNRNSLELLYRCCDAVLPKEVTIKCISKNLSLSQLDEIIIGGKNGLSEEQLLSVADKESLIDMCQTRLSYQEENERNVLTEQENASVMEDKPKGNFTLKEQVDANKKAIADRDGNEVRGEPGKGKFDHNMAK